MKYYSKHKRTMCPCCKGKLIPSNETDIIGTADNYIHIQIYKCVDCRNRIRIPVYTPITRLANPQLIMKSPDEVHNDNLA